MSFEKGTQSPSPEKKPRDAHVEIQGNTFRVKVPFLHKFPRNQKAHAFEADTEKTSELPEAELIARRLVSNPEAMIRELEKDLFKSGRARIVLGLFAKEKGTWVVDHPLPSNIMEVIRAALAHEAAINKDISSYRVNIDIRLERIGNKMSGSIPYPHVDSRGSQHASMYFMSSAPTTEQYVGTLTPDMHEDMSGPDMGHLSQKPAPEWAQQPHIEKNVARSSLLPWTLYRATKDWVHSMPEGMISGDALTDKPRFFMRISFTKLRSD